MISTALFQLIILILVMAVSGALGYWLARQRILGSSSHSTEQLDKMAKTIEQLRERASQAEADKVRALIASDRDRKRAEAWKPKTAYPAQ